MPEITDKQEIIDTWGESFADLAGHKRVHFYTDAIGVDLKSPVNLLDGTQVSQLRLAEPTTTDLLNMDRVKGEMAKVADLVTSVGDIRPAEVHKISARDFILLGEVVAAFLLDGRETPGT